MPLSLDDRLRHGALLQRIRANTQRRQQAAAELEAARDELLTLIREGWKGGLTIKDLTAAADINRQRYYDLLQTRRPSGRVFKRERRKENR